MSDTTTISSGVTSTSLTVGNGEFLLVSGTVISTIVNGGGTEQVQSAADAGTGGTASFTTVNSGGFEIVSAGGSAVSTEVTSDGTQVVSAGGVTLDTSVDSAGVESVSSGGGGNFTTVSSGGGEFVFASGDAFGTNVSAGGFLVVLPGGRQDETTGEDAVVSTGVMLYSPASGTISLGTIVGDDLVVSGGATDYVLSGGTTVSTSVGSGGTEAVYDHGVAAVTSVSSGGFQFVFSGGKATSATVGSGGFGIVSAGGTAISTSVDNGGIEIVSSGAATSFTTVSSGGFQAVSAVNSVTSTTVDVGGSIVILDFAFSDGGTATVDSSTDVLSVTEGLNTYTQQLAGTYLATDSFTLLPGSDEFTGGTQVELTSTLCFCIDTLIATPTGQVKVQDLAEGDLVMTLRGAARPITWIGTGAVLATRGRRNAATPVIVHKGALADNVPTHDLRVTKGHSLYVDHVLIPAEFLVNHRSIEWDDRAQEVKLYHIELETHDVLIANGAPAESYRDDGNRWLFRNANGGWAQPPQEPCAPVLTGGKLVDQAWQRLLDRAGPRPGLPLTEDADLHLVVDGQRLDARSCHGETLVFRLMARPETVRIVSRGGAPQELGVARDPRVLGVALWRIMLRQGPRLRMIEAEDASLAEGFHGYEADNSFRWTDGDALLPAALYDGLQGGFELELHVACSARYGDDRQARAAA